MLLRSIMPEAVHAFRLSIWIFTALFLSGFNATADELPDLRGARSVVAEAALVLRLDAQHRVTPVYVMQIEDMVRQQLLSDLKSLAPRSQGAELIRTALAALKVRDARRLDEVQQQLTRLVDMRE